MCTKPPKAPKPAPPPKVEAPEVELGSDNPNQDVRLLKRRGRSALRTGLSIERNGSGLTIN